MTGLGSLVGAGVLASYGAVQRPGVLFAIGRAASGALLAVFAFQRELVPSLITIGLVGATTLVSSGLDISFAAAGLLMAVLCVLALVRAPTLRTMGGAA